ncbi:venom carboxylesterase-6 isoform X1 [Procambarus clarkii]|uniref:venom carboxylesterase-6 isoform X1 n=1 Tax=Procambarus clarkii TaxID=6728 RepID=UPI003742D0C7
MLVWEMCVVVVVAAVVVAAQDNQTFLVQLKQGAILCSRDKAIDGKIFYSFRGIPYAQPPVGDLRFKEPVAASGWTGTRDGRTLQPVCPQLDSNALLEGQALVRGEEDCLYLNVYTPHYMLTGFPVMVWIHGGAFSMGGADEYSPSVLLTRDVILVTLQYRLGTLGFLSTEDSVLPGNMGLKDQALALRWVQDNIRDLGGDPDKVTIFGQSAGAAAAHLHVLSPHSRGLFRRAILQSGSSLSPWAIRTDHKQVATTISKVFNCSGVEVEPTALNSTALLLCLQNQTLSDLVAIPSAFVIWLNTPSVMTPRVDGDFLPDHPAALLKSRKYNRVDLITGVTQHEGALAATPVLMNEEVRESLSQDFSDVSPVVMNFEGEDSSLYLAQRAFQQYLGDLSFNSTSPKALVQLFGDRGFNMAHEETARLHARATSLGNRIFAYVLQHCGQFSVTDQYGTCLSAHWVSHADDLQYLFDRGASLPPLEELMDLQVRHLMVSMWTNFAAKGNPTPDNSLGIRWKPTSSLKLSYLALAPTPVMSTEKQVEAREFWTSLPTRENLILYQEEFNKAKKPEPRHSEPWHRPEYFHQPATFLTWYLRQHPTLMHRYNMNPLERFWL